MHGNPRQENIFAFDETPLDLTGGYSSRGYSPISTSSEYWNYGSHSLAQHEPLSYAASQKHARPWLNDSVAPTLDSSSFPRSVNTYDASLRSTDLRHHSIYNPTTDMWPSSQLSSQWSDSSNISVQSWDSMLLPGIDNSDTKPIIHHQQPQHSLPSIISGSCSPLSTISSPSPSPSPIPILQTTTHRASRKSKADIDTSTVKICSHCHATSTPLWRREPNTLKTLCNACGLYLQQRNKLRPQELIDADLDGDEAEEILNSEDTTGPQCSHCQTRKTSVWRRSKTGQKLCNACGVYSRLRGKDRPLSLKRNKIKPRTKHSK